MLTARHNPTRRPGLTLTEALVAMFVAAIGLIALMTLFPLGALQMSKALADERAYQTALQADGIVRAHWRTEVVEKRNVGRHGYPGENGPDPFDVAFRNPNFNVYSRTGGTGTEYINIYPGIYFRDSTTYPYYDATGNNQVTPAPTPGVPSFPVAIDIIGWNAREGKIVEQAWIGGRTEANPTGPLTSFPIPRRTLATRNTASPVPYVAPVPTTWGGLSPTNSTFRVLTNSNFTNSLRFSTLLDDLTYDESGTGAPPADLNPIAAAPPVGSPLELNTGKVERQGRFNWTAFLQQPDPAVEPDVANMVIGVFDGRAPGYAPANQERVYPRDSGVTTAGFTQLVVFAPGQRSVRVYYQGEKPTILKGKWILDGTIGGQTVADTGSGSLTFDPDATAPVNWTATAALNLRHLKFYRVVTATEGIDLNRANATYIDVEVEEPIQQRLDRGGPYAGTLYVLPGLMEVFRRPPLTR